MTGYTCPNLPKNLLDQFLSMKTEALFMEKPKGSYRFKENEKLEGANQLSLKLGDIFPIRQDYSLKILEDKVIVLNNAGKEDTSNLEAMRMAKMFDLLIRYSNGEITPSRVTGEQGERFDKLCILLKELGIDTTKEFTINNVSSIINNGYLQELNNHCFAYPQEILKELEKEYELFLYQHIHN